MYIFLISLYNRTNVLSREGKVLGFLSEHERQLASRFLFLSMAIIAINRDIETIQKGPFKFKEPYIQLLEQMLKRATEERRTLRQAMKKYHMKITLLQKDDLFSTYLFISNKREEKRNYFNPAIKKNVQNVFWDLLLEVNVDGNDSPKL